MPMYRPPTAPMGMPPPTPYQPAPGRVGTGSMAFVPQSNGAPPPPGQALPTGGSNNLPAGQQSGGGQWDWLGPAITGGATALSGLGMALGGAGASGGGSGDGRPGALPGASQAQASLMGLDELRQQVYTSQVPQQDLDVAGAMSRQEMNRRGLQGPLAARMVGQSQQDVIGRFGQQRLQQLMQVEELRSRIAQAMMADEAKRRQALAEGEAGRRKAQKEQGAGIGNAIGTGLGIAGAGLATFLTGGAAAPFAPAIIALGGGAGSAIGGAVS